MKMMEMMSVETIDFESDEDYGDDGDA